jgi:hypothetical protein
MKDVLRVTDQAPYNGLVDPFLLSCCQWLKDVPSTQYTFSVFYTHAAYICSGEVPELIPGTDMSFPSFPADRSTGVLLSAGGYITRLDMNL